MRNYAEKYAELCGIMRCSSKEKDLEKFRPLGIFFEKFPNIFGGGYLLDLFLKAISQNRLDLKGYSWIYEIFENY